MKIRIAMDSFKGSLTSTEAGNAVAAGFGKIFPEADIRVYPMADGGEGTVQALAALGGTVRTVKVRDPLCRPIEAQYLLLSDGTAVMEMAAAAGLPLLEPQERNPLVTTTFGVGEMIADALRGGCTKFLLGIGGSATNDGGAGMLTALGWRLADAQGNPIVNGAQGLLSLCSIDEKDVLPLVRNAQFTVACDVTNPLCGARGASAVFAPQKGAKPAEIPVLDGALARFAQVAKTVYPDADKEAAGAGAAGGLGFGLKTFLNADLRSGVESVMRLTGLTEALADADLVIVGEGRMDAQTVMGKAPAGVAKLAKQYGAAVIGIAGSIAPDADACHACIDAYFPILQKPCTLEEALTVAAARENLTKTAEEIARLWRTAKKIV